MTRMLDRLRGWWQFWMVLAVVWTGVVFASGWMNLPRAQYMPHDPQFVSKLSAEATSILRRTDARVKPVRGAIVWTDTPRFVRMSNGAQLTFPATTTGEESALVASEYQKLLTSAAEKQRAPYLLELLAIWLAPAMLLLGGGWGVSLIAREYRPALDRTTARTTPRTTPRGQPSSSIESAVTSVFGMNEDSRSSMGKLT
jgi:hypothetical protein